MDVVAFVDDLMDRSKIGSVLPTVRFGRAVDDADGADVAIVDLARHADLPRALRARSTTVRIVAFGPHVDTDRATRASDDGADVVLPRSRFFRDPAAAIA